MEETPTQVRPGYLCADPKGGAETRGHPSCLTLPHLQFPIFCVSVSNQQTYDYKGAKQEGPFTKPGGTKELKVGVWTQETGSWISTVNRWGQQNNFCSR